MELNKDTNSAENQNKPEDVFADDELFSSLENALNESKNDSAENTLDDDSLFSALEEALDESCAEDTGKAKSGKSKKKVSLRKKAKAEPQQELSADDALFDSLEKEKKRKRTKRIRIIVIIVAVLLIGGFIGTRILQHKVRTQFSSSSDEVLSAQAEKGTISTLVSGSGMLVNVDTETVSVPSGVEVTEVLVEYGDTVEVGDMLATVNMASVRTAITDVQEAIEDIDEELASAEDDSVDSYISSSVSGRVKAVYAQEGDLVEDVMVKYGCLAVLSLDGYMQAELKTDQLSTGDIVTVVLSDGTEVEGTVNSVIANKATILLTDDGPALNEEVKIRSASGTELGTATLAIHNSMSVTGYAGKISGVYAEENEDLYSYSTIFTLTDTSTSASYDSLLRDRADYEETLLDLLSLQQNSALVAPISGSIYWAVDLDDEDSDDEEILDIVTISPDKQMEVTITVDESDILSMELGQKADVTVSSIGDDVYEGEVTEIDKTYSSGYYTALITLDKVTGMIPGMTASVDIRIEGMDDVVLIPADALHQTSEGYYVYTSYNEETKEYGGRVDVVPGLSNSNYVEIKSGLNEGDTVYYVESQDFGFMFGGGMQGGFGGGMQGGNSGGMPSGGGMPNGGNSGNHSNGGGGMPSGGGMPGGFGG